MKTVIKPDIRYFDESMQRVIETHSLAQMRIEIYKAISAEREAIDQLVNDDKDLSDNDAIRISKAIKARGNK